MKNIELTDHLNDENLIELSNNIRELIISDACKNGGYLADTLSYVEIALAVKLIFSAEDDKIFITDINSTKAFDILGCNDNLNDISDNDSVFSSAYAQSIISSADNTENHIIVIIDVQSLNNAQILKRLKDIGDRKLPIIIIINDSINEAISDIPTRILNTIRSSKEYIAIKKEVVNNLDNSKLGLSIIDAVGSFKDNIKEHIIKGGIFSDFGVELIGNVDGHDVKKIIKVLEKAKESKYPVVIHALTRKGKGYRPMEDGKISVSGYFEAVNSITGKAIRSVPNGYLRNEDIILKDIEKYLALNNSSRLVLATDYKSPIVNSLKLKYKERVYADSGDKAFILAYTVASNGYDVIFVADNWKFVKNIYDYLKIINKQLKITTVLFDSSICCNDKKMHHGLDDISVISLTDIPLYQGKDINETRNILKTVLSNKHNSILRITEGVYADKGMKDVDYDILKWNYIIKSEDSNATIISYGNDIGFIENEIKMNDYSYDLLNAVDINHLDNEMLDQIFKEGKPVIIYGSDLIRNGLGERIKLRAFENQAKNKIIIIGIKDRNFKSATLTGIKKETDIEINRIFKELSEIC